MTSQLRHIERDRRVDDAADETSKSVQDDSTPVVSARRVSLPTPSSRRRMKSSSSSTSSTSESESDSPSPLSTSSSRTPTPQPQTTSSDDAATHAAASEPVSVTVTVSPLTPAQQTADLKELFDDETIIHNASPMPQETAHSDSWLTVVMERISDGARSLHSFSLPFRIAIVFALIAYVLTFSWRTHFILACAVVALSCGLSALYTNVSQYGVMSYVPLWLHPYLEAYNLVELGQLPWQSRVTLDTLTLFLFKLSEHERSQILQRLPPRLQEILTHRGIVHLLPAEIESLMYPKPTVQDAFTETTVNGGRVHADNTSLSLSSPSHIPYFQHKYDANSAGPIDDPHKSPLQPQAQTSSRLLAPSVTYAMTTPLLSSADSADDDDGKDVSFWPLFDRSIQTSFSSLFRTWAKQCYDALIESFGEQMPSILSPSNGLPFFIPLGATIITMHILSTSTRVRHILKTHAPATVDGIICVGALVAAYQLYRSLIADFAYSHSHQHARARSMSLSVHDDTAVRRNSFSLPHALSHSALHPSSSIYESCILYFHYVMMRIRRDSGLHISAALIVGWIIYISKFRQRWIK